MPQHPVVPLFFSLLNTVNSFGSCYLGNSHSSHRRNALDPVLPVVVVVAFSQLNTLGVTQYTCNCTLTNACHTARGLHV